MAGQYGNARITARNLDVGQTVAASLQAWVEQFVTGLEQGAYHEDPERGTFQRA